MATGATRAPVSLATLRQHSALSVQNPSEYSIKSWLTAARDSFERGLTLWEQARKPGADASSAEHAFVALRQGAELTQRARAHPSFKNISPTDKALLNSVQKLMVEANGSQAAITEYLERREAEWVQRHGPLSSPPPLASRTAGVSGHANGSRAGPSSPSSTRMNGTSSGNLPNLPSTPTSPPKPAVSPPLSSLKERMAALRAHGMTDTAGPVRGGGVRSEQSSSTTTFGAIRSPKVNASVTSNVAVENVTGSASRSSPPPIPSPKGRAVGDLVEDNAMKRTGSAPPAIPVTEEEDQREEGAFASLGLELSSGLPPSSPQGSPRTRDRLPSPRAQQDDLPSPTDFSQHFPSLDDFEKSVPGPSAPRPGAPSSSDVRSSTTPPPRPFEMDLNDFESQRRAHADAVRSLGKRDTGNSTATFARHDLPPALVPGAPSTGSSQQPLISKPRDRPPLPAPPASGTASSKNFQIPFTSEVGPVALYNYLATAQSELGKGPRVLLLDVRSREEFERGRVIGEAVCLEPIVLRQGITSSQIESALSLSPKHELAMFEARSNYDMVVIYDRCSTGMPGVEPPSTAAESQRVLWNLTNAIYEREFYKHLKRQPVLLKGGWDGWEKYVGAKGITRDGKTTLAKDEGWQKQDVVAQLEAKRANRKAAILPSRDAGTSLVRNGNEQVSFASAPSPSISSTSQSGYFSPAPAQYPGAPSGPSSNGLPRLPMPPTAAQRSGSTPAYEAYSPPILSPNGSQYPHQPSINGIVSSDGMPRSSSSSLLVRSRGDYGDLHIRSQQSFEPYSRPSFDYPQLLSRGTPPAVSRTNRPPPPLPEAVTRPAAVQPAPQRSNSSSFNNVQLGAYSSARSAFPTDLKFEDNVVGLTGLKNLGNTCYMNSTVQCLSAAVPFARYFKDRSYRRDINTINPLGTKGALADAVSELIRAIWAQNYTFLSPVTFRENICRVAPQFRGSDQHDAQEFLGFLLDGLHEDLNYVLKKPPPIDMTPDREHDLETLPPQIMSDREWEIYRMRNDSFIVQCFQGQFRNQLKCLTCGKTSTTYNTFMPLSIPIPSGRGATKASLEDCIRAFVREEILDKDDAWFCPQCKTNRKASKRLTLSRLPPILVIHLKRFSFRGPFSDKVETQVQYPLTGLDLTNYLPPPLFEQRPAAATTTPPKGKVYDLFGVTNHYGNLSSGHYTAFVRSGREWFNIGDSKVTQVDPRVVESAKSAYILYYALR